ncbi:MAG: hypothetical protein RPT25_08215 [Cycloclasticus sp.]|jgi:hypothetical protein
MKRISRKGIEDMDKANEALDEGKVLKSFYHAGKGIGNAYPRCS